MQDEITEFEKEQLKKKQQEEVVKEKRIIQILNSGKFEMVEREKLGRKLRLKSYFRFSPVYWYTEELFNFLKENEISFNLYDNEEEFIKENKNQ